MLKRILLISSSLVLASVFFFSSSSLILSIDCPPGYTDVLGSCQLTDPGSVGSTDVGTLSLPDFIKNISLQSIASNAAKLILAIAGLLFFFYLLFGGIRMMTSAGDEKSAASARSAVTTGLLGFLLVVSAYFIALFIEEVFHIPIINVTIPGVN